MNIAILITCQNERDKILSLIESCYIQIDKIQEKSKYLFTIHLLDNGSKDYLKEAVVDQFPDVKIYKQVYNCQWNNDLRNLCRIVSKDNYDYYIWINKDVILKENAIYSLIETSNFLKNNAIVVGNIVNKSNEIVFGGYNNAEKLIEPDPILPKPIKVFDGMLVLIPSTIYNKIGDINKFYKYRYADWDYSCMARKKDVVMVIAPQIQGIDYQIEEIPKWRDGKYSLLTRYKYLNSTNGEPLKEKFRYDCKNYNIFRSIFNYFYTLIRLLLPITNS